MFIDEYGIAIAPNEMHRSVLRCPMRAGTLDVMVKNVQKYWRFNLPVGLLAVPQGHVQAPKARNVEGRKPERPMS